MLSLVCVVCVVCVCAFVRVKSCYLCVGIREEIREVAEGVYSKESNVLKVGQGVGVDTALWNAAGTEYTLYS